MSVLHHMLLSRVTNNIPNYFCLVALEDGTFTFNIDENAQLTSIAYSLDGRNWTSSTTTLTTPTIAKGKSVYWKGTATKYSSNSDNNTNNSYFSSTGDFYVKGDLMSLFYGDNFKNQFEIPDTYAAASLFENCTKLLYANKLILKATILKTGCYGRMFYNCTHLLAYPKLPATSLAQKCYAFMFGYCRSMITAPELPATDLDNYCYLAMFYYCDNLINPPVLSATILSPYCYMRMFERCSDLEVAPDLLASNLERYCYYYMFRYCTKLRFINAQFEDTTIPNSALRDWVSNVASEGIFLKNPVSEFNTVGDSGIPTGWTVWTEVPDWLCFTALERGTFTLTVPATVTTTYLSYVEWSKDGRTWNHTDNTSEAVTIDVQVASGDNVYWRGSGSRMGTSASNTATTDSIFTATGDFEVSGNIMSLLYGNSFDGVTSLPIGSEYTFAGLFYNNKKLLSIADLSLPATALVKGCYASTFYGCSNMTGMLSSLPATSYPMTACYMMFHLCSKIDAVPSLKFVSGNGGYQFQYMFARCTSLVDASAIVMSGSDTYSFSAMFMGCSALAVTPVMSLSTLKTGCFNITFQDCTNLKYVKCLATDISATNCLNNWLRNVSSTGTFIQAPGIVWPRGVSGIPTGWADVEKRTMPAGYKQVEYLQAVKPFPTNYSAAIVGTGIVLDPSQDTIEFAVRPRLDEDGYLINGSDTIYGEMPFANSSSPTANNVKVGTFYVLYRVNSSTNRLQCTYTIENGDNTVKAVAKTVFINKGVTDNPQTIRIEFSSTSAVMLLNGTQVHSVSGYTIDTSDMTTTQAFVLSYNNSTYNWEHPFYYLKWWRGSTMIADYVPCVRESDDEVGFYDFISQTFKTRYYTNSNALIAGEEV